MRYGLRFGLLGSPVLYDDDGTVRPIGGGKMRDLFVALLLEPGRVVPVEALKDALWHGAPPPSAQASLQNHVTRLRRLLDDPERLRAVPPGYLLRVAEGELDVHAFEAHVAAARSAHTDRDRARALREATAALALWRGTPLGGLPEDSGEQAFVQRLEEARLLVLEWRYDAELGLAEPSGRTGGPDGAGAVDGEGPARLAALAPELSALVAEHPLREAFHRLLMLVLHRTGRQAEALAVHRDLRARLVEELGVEPGPAVRDAHLEVLQDEPPPTTPRTPRPAAPEPPRPAQLPARPIHFTGRGDTVKELHLALGTGGGDGAGGTDPAGRAPAVTVISGMAGVGKSALALHVAHELADRFPDGQLYVNLHGATPGMTPLTATQALASLLRDLGTEPRLIPEHPDAAAALLRSVLAPTRTLMVLDDAAHAAQVRPLLPAGAGCAVIVTSRSPLTALDGAHRFPLAPLSDEDSAALLRAASGRDGLDGAHALVELTGRLPLALRVVAARLAARRALTPDALAGQLAATERRLHHLEYDDLSVRRSLAVAHDALRASDREADRDAALALHRIGALDLPAYGAPLLARLTGTDERRAEAALDRLVDVALLEETSYGRYQPHDLVRDFAREIAESEPARGPESGPGGARVGHGGAGVVEGALRWYADRARQCLVALLPPGHERDERLEVTAGEPPPVDTCPFPSAEAAFAWADRELPSVVALVKHRARPAGPPSPLVPALVRHLFPYLQRSGRLGDLDTLSRLALETARSVGDDAAEAFALTDRAGLYFLSGRLTEALALNDEGLALWRGLDAVSCIRRCLNNRGLLLESLGRYEESEEALRQSLELSRQLCDPYGQAVTFSHLGKLYAHTDPRAAIVHHQRSLALGDLSDSVVLTSTAHCNIGYAHLRLGEPARAVLSFEQSLEILGDDEDWGGESRTRLGLVRALRALDRDERAGHECARLLDLAERRADRYTIGLARHQRGLLLAGQGRAEEAYRDWASALEVLDGTQSRVVGELRDLLAGRSRP
jgi:DNA-binding SARP family transcriptional activator/tetratricopeptide (TPR) repeat protein